jgi:hypothetical protein
VLAVQNRDMKLLDREIHQPAAEYLEHIARTPDRDSVVTIFCDHPTAELERGMDLLRPVQPDTVDAQQLRRRLHVQLL